MANREMWISGAVKRPGRVTARAARTGGLTRKGTLKASWLHAQLAKTRGKGGEANRSWAAALRLAKRFHGGI